MMPRIHTLALSCWLALLPSPRWWCRRTLRGRRLRRRSATRRTAAVSAAVSAAGVWRARRRGKVVVSSSSAVAIQRSSLAQRIAAHCRIAQFFRCRKHNETFVPDQYVDRRLVMHVNEWNAERLLEAALDTGMHQQWRSSCQSKDSSPMTLRPEKCPAIIERRRE